MKIENNKYYYLESLITTPMKGNYFYKRLGSRIKIHRKLNNLSQEQLSLRSAVDRTYLSRIEFGRANPSIKTLYKFCRVFKVRLSKLLEGV